MNIMLWATVCKTVRPMLSNRCLSVLSVTLVYCGQTVGWIKMKLGTEVGLGPSHIVLDGDPAPLPKRSTAPPIFSPCLLWPNGWIKMPLGMEVGPRPTRHCVRCPQKGGTAPPPIFAHVYCGQTVGRIKMKLGMEAGSA